METSVGILLIALLSLQGINLLLSLLYFWLLRELARRLAERPVSTRLRNHNLVEHTSFREVEKP